MHINPVYLFCFELSPFCCVTHAAAVSILCAKHSNELKVLKFFYFCGQKSWGSFFFSFFISSDFSKNTLKSLKHEMNEHRSSVY